MKCYDQDWAQRDLGILVKGHFIGNVVLGKLKGRKDEYRYASPRYRWGLTAEVMHDAAFVNC